METISFRVDDELKKELDYVRMAHHLMLPRNKTQ
jgi:hypothetical protein